MNDVVIYSYGHHEIEGVTTPEGVALSDEQIGIALAYAEPAKAISKIAERNAAELEGLSTFVKVTRVEGGREVTRSIRVWGQQGVMALTFLAKTPKAVEFRKWARETLYATQVAPRNPITEVDKLAGTLSQMLPALAGKVTEVATRQVEMGDRLAAVEEKQKTTDPQAIEARMKYLDDCKTLLVFGTKGKPQAVTFNGYWRALKDLIGINSFTNRAALTVPMMDKCIEYAQEWCRTRGLTPPELNEGLKSA